MITSIYRIKTKNSIYEIQVNDAGTSRCRKEGETTWNIVKATSPEYLEKLSIGPSFDVPGVVLTSMVEDYVHLVPSGEPKRQRSTAGGMSALTAAIVAQVKGQVAVVNDRTPLTGDEVLG